MNIPFVPWKLSPSINFCNYKYYIFKSKIIPSDNSDALIFKFEYGNGIIREEKFKIHNESYILFIDTNSLSYDDHIYKLKIVDKYSYLNEEYELTAPRIQDYLRLKEIPYEDFCVLENSFSKIEKYLLLE